jgi:hypothetical protein
VLDHIGEGLVVGKALDSLPVLLHKVIAQVRIVAGRVSRNPDYLCKKIQTGRSYKVVPWQGADQDIQDWPQNITISHNIEVEVFAQHGKMLEEAYRDWANVSAHEEKDISFGTTRTY